MTAEACRVFMAQPAFRRLEKERRRLSWGLLVVVLAAYFGYILCVAYRPDLMARPIMDGSVITIGILVGLAIMLLAFVANWLYVRFANLRFDAMRRQLREKV